MQAKLGRVTLIREGDDAFFKCECGAEEKVINFENGAEPKEFVWRITFNTEHSQCYKCGKEHNSNIGNRYN